MNNTADIPPLDNFATKNDEYYIYDDNYYEPLYDDDEVELNEESGTRKTTGTQINSTEPSESHSQCW